MTAAVPPRILIVDDNPAIHDDFRKILNPAENRNSNLDAVEAVLFEVPQRAEVQTRFRLESAYQGQEALEKVQEHVAQNDRFAVAFVDVRMPPGWDGIETIERLWEVDPALQVVVCTAYSDYSWEKMSERLGVNDNLVILKKPFDNVEVVQLAHALTKKWQVTKQAELRLAQLDQMVSERTAELRRSEERFETAFRASPVALAIQTIEDDRFIDVNDAFATLAGVSREHILGTTMLDLRLAIDYEGGSPNSTRDCPAQVTTRDGDIRDVLVSTSRISLTGQPHVLLILQDVSDRIRLESQLRQAQKMEAVGQLAAGVAHDFNNLLTIIEGHASLQLAMEELSPEAQASLGEIELAAERAAELTKQLLAFSRRQIMRPRVLELNTLIDDLLGMLRRMLEEKIDLVCELGDDLPLICADRTSIEQVIMNLSVNARDAMVKGGTITFSTRCVTVPTHSNGRYPPEAKPGRYVCLSVSDNGVGMDEATRARIFEPFFTTKEVHKGTGMGLSTVYGIVRQHDGWIDVRTSPGRGSTFQIHFPVTDKSLEPPAETVIPEAPPGDTRAIFAVEDDGAVRGLVREILEHHGYRVVEAESGDAALALWPRIRHEVDLLLTDMVMPGEHNGLDLARKLLADKPDLKVIYTSGYSRELFSSDVSLQDGVNYLPKPYLTSKLLAIIRQAFDVEPVSS